MKYIDIEKLISEIEKRIEETKSMKPSFDKFWAGQISAFKGVITIIASLQQEQPEVDLEKEIARENEKWTCYEDIGFGALYDARPFDGRDIERIARHFYELGISKKEE